METADERDCLQQMFWDEDSGNGQNINLLWKEGRRRPLFIGFIISVCLAHILFNLEMYSAGIKTDCHLKSEYLSLETFWIQKIFEPRCLWSWDKRFLQPWIPDPWTWTLILSFEGVSKNFFCCFIGSVRHIEVAEAWTQITYQFSFPETRFY